MKQESVDDCVSCRTDFLQLSTAIDLNSLAAALRPLVGAEFESRQYEFVECMVASWDGHEFILAHPLEAVLPEYACDGQLTENNAATSGTKAHCVATLSADSMSVTASVSTELLWAVSTTLAKTRPRHGAADEWADGKISRVAVRDRVPDLQESAISVSPDALREATIPPVISCTGTARVIGVPLASRSSNIICRTKAAYTIRPATSAAGGRTIGR